MTEWTRTKAPVGFTDEADRPSAFDDDRDHHAHKSSTRPGLGRILGLVFAGVFAVAIVALIVQNTQTSHVSWLWLDTNVSQWILLATAFVAGLIVGPLTVAGIRFSSHRRD